MGMTSDGELHELSPEAAKALKDDMLEGKLRELVPVYEAELARVKAMNRHDRRAWYARRRRQAKKLQKRAEEHGV